MGLGNLFKLEKLKIRAYKSRARGTGDLLGTFEAMFNPESYQQTWAITYGPPRGTGTSLPKAIYHRHKPSDLKIKLLLDGTGVDEMGIAALAGRKTVAKRVEEFLKLTFRMRGQNHEPNYLKVEWGDLIFSCRLGSVVISYTSFDRDGTALRAELDTTFLAEVDDKKRLAEENKSSPDLTHHRVVRAGDSLLLLTKEIYGTADPYLVVAAANGLDDFRNLVPGQERSFRPRPALPTRPVRVEPHPMPGSTLPTVTILSEGRAIKPEIQLIDLDIRHELTVPWAMLNFTTAMSPKGNSK
jgi:hypothetical protein